MANDETEKLPQLTPEELAGSYQEFMAGVERIKQLNQQASEAHPPTPDNVILPPTINQRVNKINIKRVK